MTNRDSFLGKDAKAGEVPKISVYEWRK